MQRLSGMTDCRSPRTQEPSAQTPQQPSNQMAPLGGVSLDKAKSRLCCGLQALDLPPPLSSQLLRKKGLPGEGPCVTALGHAHPVTTSESSGSERSVSGCGV